MTKLRATAIAGAVFCLAAPSALAHASTPTVYNGQTAAAYADKYALNYNQAYPSFANKGGDCTNFVSQALAAGGLNERYSPPYSGNQAWYIQQVHKSWSYALPWVNAQDNSIFLQNNLKVAYPSDVNATVVANVYFVAPGQTVATNASQGDVVLYDWNNDGTFDHEAIITANDGSGWDLVDAHTNNRYHAYWTLAQYNASWQTTHIIVLHFANGTE